MAIVYCTGCGSPFCIGSCASSAQQQSNAQLQYAKQYKDNLMLYQQLMGYGGGGLSALGIPIEQEIAKRSKPLPEESEFCATGGIIAWREWRIPCFGDVLLSINGEQWPVRQMLVAKCKNGPTNCLGAHCDCGIYGWKKQEDLKVNDSNFSFIRGEVWFWGKVIEHAKGYRAQFAYPKSFVKCADAERAAKLYGVKLI